MPNPITDPLVEGPDSDTQTNLVVIDGDATGMVTLTVNRPERRNAFNAEVIAALNQALETLEGADGVRVVFVRGEGEHFSAGADLDWMAEAITLSEADNRADAMGMATMLKRLYDLPVLTVALVEGSAFGGGAGLVAACDMAIATENAQFSFSEVKLGLIPATISPYVVTAIGPRKARSLFATGRVFDAAFAKEIGLVDEIVEGGPELIAARDRIAEEILACGPEAVGESKRLVEHIIGRHLDHALMDETAKRIAARRVSEEGQEGVRAFLERRKPSWLTEAEEIGE